MAIPALYDVVVSFPSGEAGTTMALSCSGVGEDWRADLDGDLRVVFSEVPAGRYTLQCWAPYSSMEGEVPCGPIHFEAKALNALQVEIKDPNGALAQAGFLDQDLIIGVDGEEFEGDEDFARIWRARKAMSLILLRSGSRIELPSMELPWKVDAWQNAGGNLAPASR